MQNLIQQVHPQWRDIVTSALNEMDPDYLKELQSQSEWLPQIQSIFAAYSLPLDSANYILLGESPYPRAQSANGYAFWDAAVGGLWGKQGLSTEVNRATSLRNFIKMLLHARGDLNKNFSKDAIAKLDRSSYLQTADELFSAMTKKGFILLNASLIYSEGKINYHARHWRPFLSLMLTKLALYKPNLQLILFGRVAEKIPEAKLFKNLIAEHPFNTSFITNPEVLAFFKPMDLLRSHENKS